MGPRVKPREKATPIMACRDTQTENFRHHFFQAAQFSIWISQVQNLITPKMQGAHSNNRKREKPAVSKQMILFSVQSGKWQEQAVDHHCLRIASVRCCSLPRKQNEHVYFALEKKRIQAMWMGATLYQVTYSQALKTGPDPFYLLALYGYLSPQIKMHFGSPGL